MPYLLRVPRIAGEVFDDRNANSWRDADEDGLAGRTVFVDMNESGTRDAGDIEKTTDADGRYAFDLPSQQTYVVRLANEAGWLQSTPAGGSEIDRTRIRELGDAELRAAFQRRPGGQPVST